MYIRRQLIFLIYFPFQLYVRTTYYMTRISPEVLLSTIATKSTSSDYKQHKYWDYDPWLRQFSTWFTCRATNGENSTNKFVNFESSVKVLVQIPPNTYGESSINSFSPGFPKSAIPVQLGQGNLTFFAFK